MTGTPRRVCPIVDLRDRVTVSEEHSRPMSYFRDLLLGYSVCVSNVDTFVALSVLLFQNQSPRLPLQLPLHSSVIVVSEGQGRDTRGPKTDERTERIGTSPLRRRSKRSHFLPLRMGRTIDVAHKPVKPPMSVSR